MYKYTIIIQLNYDMFYGYSNFLAPIWWTRTYHHTTIVVNMRTAHVPIKIRYNNYATTNYILFLEKTDSLVSIISGHHRQYC